MVQKTILNFRVDPDLHQRIRKRFKSGEVSKFIEEAIDKELTRQELFEQKLVADYQSVAKNQKLQKEQEVWDETISDMWRKDNGK